MLVAMKLFCSLLISIPLLSGICIPAYSQGYTHSNANITTNLASPQDSLTIKVASNRLIINNLPKDDVLEIYNIMGVKVLTRRVKAGTNEYPINLSKGYYIIKIGKLTKKIAIK